MTRLALILGVALTGALLTPLALAEDGGATVTIHNYAYEPPVITIPKGGKVTWINKDDTPHTVVATDKQFRSPAIDTGDSFSRTYNEVGTFGYVCGLHPQMKGSVVVTPEVTAAPSY
jgi:plastocyanin